ncbi:molybdopterin molybdenumtransferase MoeA, partial [Cellulosimicrobium cellulans]|nr:molybdopterin molybdenumtransferase MoeA [Cellulosimicrobium cellulans]
VLVRHTEPDGARVVPAGRRPEEDATARGSGSHRLSALAHADALAVVGAEVTAVAPGDPVQVLLL